MNGVTALPNPVVSHDQLGPIDYLAVEFGHCRIDEEEAALLLHAVDHGEVRDLDGMLAQLQTLGEPRDRGVLTDAEFEEQKRRLLAA